MSEIENEPNFEETENLLKNDFVLSPPERHGCVTAWLIIMLVSNAIVSLVYFLMANGLMHGSKLSSVTLMALTLIGMLNVTFSIMLLSWKKIAFYGFGIIGVFTFLLNISVGISPLGSLFGLAGVAILYGILQIKKNGIAAWNYLK